jgi:hypothetical protein
MLTTEPVLFRTTDRGHVNSSKIPDIALGGRSHRDMTAGVGVIMPIEHKINPVFIE